MPPPETPPDKLGRQIARPVPLRQSVYEAILEMIVNRTLGPGQHLVENELAVMLGVSRQPVREALQWLKNDGWVDLRPAHGAFVHAPTAEEADQLLAVRTLLEAESARVAALHAGEADLATLRELCQRGLAAVESDDVDGMVSANAEFHAAVALASGNKVLVELAGQVDRRVRWYYNPVARTRGGQSWVEHADLVDAIAARDADRAADIMRAHTEHTRQSYLAQASEPSTGDLAAGRRAH
ncbi:GntR family transcriptional regulator [Pseudonocardia acaciae]|uniref:GntR family transcriptional regulator n=1 Tax=Pseudonocardia acaciae TaxID=551276 RepID=UPI00068635C9|nr:GntR family transcriptional regulator [Pseudonocardia acaciae]